MTADFTGTLRSMFRAQVEADENVRVEPVHGSPTPVKLAFAVYHYPEQQRPMTEMENGAIVELDMRWEELMGLYARIHQFAQQRGWPLPE